MGDETCGVIAAGTSQHPPPSNVWTRVLLGRPTSSRLTIHPSPIVPMMSSRDDVRAVAAWSHEHRNRCGAIDAERQPQQDKRRCNGCRCRCGGGSATCCTAATSSSSRGIDACGHAHQGAQCAADADGAGYLSVLGVVDVDLSLLRCCCCYLLQVFTSSSGCFETAVNSQSHGRRSSVGSAGSSPRDLKQILNRGPQTLATSFRSRALTEI